MWAAASALTSAVGPVLGGWLTESFGWPAIFWINPPLAVVAIALIWFFASQDFHEPRQFDVLGAGLIAAALASMTWALSQIGRSEPRTEFVRPDMMTIIIGVLGIAGVGIYVLWERMSTHPMIPPRVATNRAFVGLNAATLLIYSGLSIMFFLLPFDLIDRRGLFPISAGLALLPFTVGVGVLSPLFGGLVGKFGTRSMLVIGAGGASIAYLWMALAQDASLVFGVISPLTLLGIAFAVLIAPLTSSVISSVPKSDEGLASGINNAVSRVAQLAGTALAAGLGTLSSGYEFGLLTAAVVSAAGAVTTALEVPGR